MKKNELNKANSNAETQLAIQQGVSENIGIGLSNQPVENYIRPEEQPKEKPFFEGFGKGFKVFLDDNTLLSTTKYISEEGFNLIPEQLDPNYDPFNDIPQDKLDYIGNYKYANTPEEVGRISARIDRENENRRILDQEVGTGAQLASGLLAGILDPVNFIPVGGEAYQAFKIGKIGQGVLRTATAGLVSATAAEGILQQTQETRSREESAMNIASATILSGVLGAAGSLFSKEKFHEVSGKVNKDINSDKANLIIDPNTQELISNNKSELIRDIDPEVRKIVNDFISKQLPTIPDNEHISNLETQKLNLQNKLSEFNDNANQIFTEKLRELGYPIDVVQGYTNQIEEFTKQRQEKRSAINPGKTGKRLRLFDEETNQKLEELRSNLDFIKSENDQGKFKEVSSKIRQDRQEIANQIKDLDKQITSAKENPKFIPENIDKKSNESISTIVEEVQPLSENQLPEEARSVGARQNLPYQDLYDKYLEENLPTGKQPITFEQFRNQLESLAPGIGGIAAKTAKLLSKSNPILRTFNTKSVEAKILLQELATHDMLVGKNEYGIANQQSVETAIKQWRAGIGEALPDNIATFKEFKQRIAKEGIQTNIKNRADFNVEVSKALRRGDISPIPEVQKAAKNWREKVFEPLKKAAIETQLLPEDVKPETAISYLSRLWNRKIVIAREPELREIISNKLKNVELPKLEIDRQREISALETQADRLKLEGKEKDYEKAREKFIEARQKFEADFEDKEGYVRDIVDNILSNLKGEQRFDTVSNYDFKITKRGPLKERTLNFIRDEEVEQFLHNDVEDIAQRYVRIMGTDVELKRQFGDVNFEDRLSQVKEDYERLADKAKTEKEREKIQDEKKRVLYDLESLRDVMRGIYGTPENPDSLIVRTGRVGRQLSYVTKLGGVVVSSLPDPLNVIGVHGMLRFSKGLKHVILNNKAVKLNIKEAKRAGNILENVLHTRLASLAELTDPYNTGNSVFERFINNLATLSTKIFGLGLWTDVMKSFSSVLTQQRLIEESFNLLKGKIKKSDRNYLAFLGIDENNAKRIINQVEKFSTKENDLWVANTDKWSDREAVRLYRNALNQDVDRTIVTPNAGDVPLFLHKELGKSIGQFKSFTFASTQQVLIARLQQKDAAALNGFISAISAGMLVYYLKTISSGKEPSNDPRKWIVEGIDRSGILGIVMEINNVAEKINPKLGINGLIGSEIMTRYASRNLVDTFAGPTAGQIEDMRKVASAIISGKIKQSDVKAFRRMIPYQNVFYLQWLFDQAEKGFDQQMGIEKK